MASLGWRQVELLKLLSAHSDGLKKSQMGHSGYWRVADSLEARGYVRRNALNHRYMLTPEGAARIAVAPHERQREGHDD